MADLAPWLDSLLASDSPDPKAVTAILQAIDGFNDERTGKLIFATVQIPGADQPLREAALRAANAGTYRPPNNSYQRFDEAELALSLLGSFPQEDVSVSEGLSWLHRMDTRNLHRLQETILRGNGQEGPVRTAPMSWMPLEVRTRFLLYMGVSKSFNPKITQVLQTSEELTYTLNAAIATVNEVPEEDFAAAVVAVDHLDVNMHGTPAAPEVPWSSFVKAASLRSMAALLNDPRGQFPPELLDQLPVSVLARSKAPSIPLIAQHVAERINADPEAWTVLLRLSENPAATLGQVTSAAVGSTRRIPKRPSGANRVRKP